MSIDFEVPAEAKAIREKVRKWVKVSAENLLGGEGNGFNMRRQRVVPALSRDPYAAAFVIEEGL